MTTVHDVLRMIRKTSVTNHERGSRFEQLMRAYLGTDLSGPSSSPTCGCGRTGPVGDGKPDTGIDLVARSGRPAASVRSSASSTPRSHRCRRRTSTRSSPLRARSGFTRRLIVSTTEKWSTHAEEALEDQQIPVSPVGLSDLDRQHRSTGRVSVPVACRRIELTSVHAKKQPRPHQQDALNDVFAGLRRGRLAAS